MESIATICYIQYQLLQINTNSLYDFIWVMGLIAEVNHEGDNKQSFQVPSSKNLRQNFINTDCLFIAFLVRHYARVLANFILILFTLGL